MSQIETEYNEFISTIDRIIPNADVDLLIKIMYLEKKLSDISPQVELHIKYDQKVDHLRKQEKIRAKYGFPIQSNPHGLTAVRQMNVDLIEQISQDQDIKHISGTATPASY